MTMTTTPKQVDAEGFDLRDNYVSTFWADGPSRQYPDFLDPAGDLHVYLGKVDGVARYAFTTDLRGRVVTDADADELRRSKREHWSEFAVPTISAGRTRETAEQSYGPLVNRVRDTARTVHPWQAQADATNHVAEDTGRAPTAADIGRARTAEDEVAVLRERAATAERQAALAAQATERVRETHEAFKVRVREHAIEVAERQGWCDQGLGETLEFLGLPPLVREWTMQLTVSVTVSGADSESEAVRWAERAIQSNDGDVDAARAEVITDTIEAVED